MSKEGWGVVVGRFQGPDLHKGHREMLNYVTQQHGDKVLVIIGVNPASASRQDPLGYIERAMMVKNIYNLQTAPLSNHRSDKEWSKSLDKLIRTTLGMRKVTIYTGRDGFQDHYSGGFDVRVLNLTQELHSNTAVRAAISETDDRGIVGNRAFREGIIFATNRKKILDLAVDGAVLSPKGELLLGKKAEDGGLFRFPGGMVDLGDPTLECAVSREVREETGIMIGATDWEYVGSCNIPDWRVKDPENHAFHSILFTATAVTSEPPRAADDLDLAVYVPFDQLNPTMLVEEHRQFYSLITWYLTLQQLKKEALI